MVPLIPAEEFLFNVTTSLQAGSTDAGMEQDIRESIRLTAGR